MANGMTDNKKNDQTTRKPDAPGVNACPSCRQPTPGDAEHAPFCSMRCRMADLGQWFDGQYVISRDIRMDDEL